MATELNIRPRPSLEEVRNLLAQLLSEVGRIPIDRIIDGATVDEGLRMESVAFVELQVSIEDYYNIEIDPIEVVERGEFGAIARYIHSRIANEQ